ncbi:sigma-54-dependent Fis family transcriptional regulator [Candidatus Peregrinibacteria bacterium]|nr:sigma-54-dependent Fis family transcriptional regulator [Candidatus Peregrinibacteria bacterium]
MPETNNDSYKPVFLPISSIHEKPMHVNARRDAGLVVEGDIPESTSGIAAAWEQGIFGSNSRGIINILITGESGTGKEPMARAIANLINGGCNLQATNCAAIADTLAESDLFGHEQGAFTDAKKQRIGLFETANANGIVHLDEIGHLALHIQAKLLRLLDDPYTFRRVGGAEVKFTGRAVIATTSDDLEVKAQRNDFNRALLNRLSSIHLTLPTLGARPTAHCLALIDHFLCQLSAKYENTITMTDDAIATLLTMTFPSNIRGLRDMIIKAHLCTMLMDEGSTCIRSDHIIAASRAQKQDMPNGQVDGTISALKNMTQRDEKAIIRAALESEKWRRKPTAARLGISRSTLYKKMKQYEFLDAETVDGVRDQQEEALPARE